MLLFFNDKRYTAAVLVVWSAVMLSIFFALGVLHSSFFRFGPGPDLKFMSIKIDTIEEWGLLAIYCCVDTMIKSFGHDAVIPWVNHTVSDPKCTMLPYSKATCLIIIEIYFSYVHLSHVFKFFLTLTQIDFILISAVSDLGIKIYSYTAYMQNKNQPSNQMLLAEEESSSETG